MSAFPILPEYISDAEKEYISMMERIVLKNLQDSRGLIAMMSGSKFVTITIKRRPDGSITLDYRARTSEAVTSRLETLNREYPKFHFFAGEDEKGIYICIDRNRKEDRGLVVAHSMARGCQIQ